MNEVHAVKTESQRLQVEALLAQRGQIYLDIWKFGVNTALRISDILSISFQDIRNLDPNRPALNIKELKTGKIRTILLNDGAMTVIDRRVKTNSNDIWLFQSTAKITRKQQMPISRRSVGRIFESVGVQTNPRVQLGTHSMRKTRGYCLHSAGHSIEKISKILNHSSTTITMRYIGLTQSDIDDSFIELVL